MQSLQLATANDPTALTRWLETEWIPLVLRAISPGLVSAHGAAVFADEGALQLHREAMKAYALRHFGWEKAASSMIALFS